MPKRKLATMFQAAFGVACLSICPTQAQPPVVPSFPQGLFVPIEQATPPMRAVVRPGEPGVDGILGQLEQVRSERVALDTKERALTELLKRKLAEQGERFKKLGLGASAPAGEAAKPAGDRKSTRLNSSHSTLSRMPSSA